LKTLKKILSWTNKYTATVASLAVGLFFLYHHTTRPTLSSSDDILNIGGRITNYSFKIGGPSARATSKQYYIWLDNYPCTFQIKADFLSFFYQTKFENEIKKGDNLKLTIPKEYESQLYERGRNIFILSASKGSTDYLSLDETIPKENDNFDIYAGLAFITAGLIYYILKSKAIIK
jgi:hypothetical protein